ncbi:unnamed protein product [Schistocephalus solidus]|uniref:Secreted protein n=1 Tax=Schistocephalus solidus TaxID=70667 RepID=A0A183TFP8_SCHSO|nr:unnamed protein product [Schistocephalus solidus]
MLLVLEFLLFCRHLGSAATSSFCVKSQPILRRCRPKSDGPTKRVSRSVMRPESSIMPGWSINRPQCVAHLQRLCLSLLLTSAALSSTYSLTWLN